MKKILVSMLVFCMALVSGAVAPMGGKTANALPAPTDYSFTSLLDGLLYYFPFDNNLVEYPVRYNNGASTTAYYDVDSVIGRSLFFNKFVPSVVEIQDDPTNSNFDEELSLSTWFKLPNGKDGGEYTVIVQRDGFGENFQLYANYFDELYFTVWDRLGAEHSYAFDSPALPNQWHHVVVNVKANEYVRIYFDGVLAYEETAFVPSQINNSVSKIFIGNDFYGAYMDGWVDELAVWNRVLLEDEIAHLYDDGMGNPIPVVYDYLNFNFEDATKRANVVPTVDSLDEYYPDIGNSGGISLHGDQEFYLWGVGSDGTGTNAPITRNWVDGAGVNYYRVQLDAEGLQDLKVSSRQRSSNTGPRDFRLQYSTSGRMPLVWNDVPGGDIVVGDNFTSGRLIDLDLPAECNDSRVLYLRWLQTSNTSVNGGLVASAGTNRIDDIEIKGTKINFTPELSSLSPSNVVVGSADTTIEVIGKQFTSGSLVYLSGVPLATTYKSSTKLEALVPAGNLAILGTFPITVFTPTPGGGISNSVDLTVGNPVPVLTTIDPDNGVAGSAGFTMTVTGNDFVNGNSVVRFDGSDKVTTFVDSGTLEATIPASDLLVAGDFDITVFTSGPGGGESLAQVYTLVDAVPSVSSISPVSKVQNSGAFILTVYGAGFASSSVVRFNGVDRATTYVNSTTLTASIPASDLVALGVFPIQVFTPAPGGGLSVAENFSVVSAPAPAPSSGGGGGVVILPVQLANVYDISGSEIVIEDALDLKSENIRIRFEGFKNANQYIVSEDENFKGARWQSFEENASYRLSSDLGRKTLYFKFRNTQNHVSEVVLKNVNLIKNGGEILHESAPELEFSKLSMNERVRANLEARRAKRLEWLKERQNYEFKEIVIPYEVNNGSLSVNIKNVPIDFKFERFLQVGMRGDDILNLQKILQELGYFDFEEGPTGYFGEVTKKALIDFQIDNSLAPFPGTLGPKTRELLNNEYLYLL